MKSLATLFLFFLCCAASAQTYSVTSRNDSLFLHKDGVQLGYVNEGEAKESLKKQRATTADLEKRLAVIEGVISIQKAMPGDLNDRLALTLCEEFLAEKKAAYDSAKTTENFFEKIVGLINEARKSAKP